MRLDKFLKVSRLIKRRTIAKEVASNDRILINGFLAKPSSNVKIGDILEIRFGNKIITIKINSINEFIKKDECNLMYDLINEIKKD